MEKEQSGLKMLVSSSADRDKLSMSIKGVITLLAGLTIPNFDLASSGVLNLVDIVLNTGHSLVIAGGSIMAMVGGFRAVYVYFKEHLKK